MSDLEDECLDKSVLLGYFIILKQNCKVIFHRGVLSWESNAKPYVNNTLPARNMLGVHYNHSPNRLECCGDDDSASSITEKSTLSDGSSATSGNVTRIGHTSFKIHYVRRSKSNCNKLRYEEIDFHQTDTRVISSWALTLKNFLKGIKERPQCMLVFVNPFGGKRKGHNIYEDQVKPLFEIAGIKTTAVVTERQDHARDFLMNEDLSSYDGVACIGGDGTFAEVFNGLVMRTARDDGINLNDQEATYPAPKLKVGVIPGGSTDTMAYCMHGTIQVQTAILHIILGDSVGLDLSSVHTASKAVRFYSSVVSYGFLGDVCVDSEKFRWMGPKRYDYSGFKTFMANKGYEGEVTLLVDPRSPFTGPRCIENCDLCYSSSDGDIARSDIADRLPEAKTIRGKFFMVSGANVSCACVKSPNGLSPNCHLGDGCVDVLIIHHTHRFNNLRLLLTLSSKDPKKNVSSLPFVEVHRVREFTFRPLGCPPGATHLTSSKVSAWNCDGEPQDDPQIKIRVHRQLIQVYSRRMPEPNEEGTPCCSCPKFLNR